MGSSPPVRGAHTVCPIPRRPAGLIPARAGSTAAICSSVTCSGAHPRPCGEHKRTAWNHATRAGSSPPVRGALIFSVVTDNPIGLIPARAGSTTPRPSASPASRAHPRPCGEHRWKMRARVRGMGSSPLARGTQQSLSLAVPAPGLIPARAGNTRGESVQVIPGGAHPRSRGEHCKHTRPRCVPGGSSPLARGTQRMLSVFL